MNQDHNIINDCDMFLGKRMFPDNLSSTNCMNNNIIQKEKDQESSLNIGLGRKNNKIYKFNDFLKEYNDDFIVKSKQFEDLIKLPKIKSKKMSCNEKLIESENLQKNEDFEQEDITSILFPEENHNNNVLENIPCNGCNESCKHHHIKNSSKSLKMNKKFTEKHKTRQNPIKTSININNKSLLVLEICDGDNILIISNIN